MRTLEQASINTVLRYVDGIILASSRMSDATIRKLCEIKPVVSINRNVRGVVSVIADTSTGIEQAVTYLASKGHKSISYLSGPEASWQSGIRWRQLNQYCAAHGIETLQISCKEPTHEGGLKAVSRFLSNRTDAVLAYNDNIAVGFMSGLIRSGLTIPDDVSIVGIDDIPLSSYVIPTLSTIEIPRRQLGEQAASLLIDHITHTSHSTDENKLLETHFVPRNSTGAISTC